MLAGCLNARVTQNKLKLPLWAKNFPENSIQLKIHSNGAGNCENIEIRFLSGRSLSKLIN